MENAPQSERWLGMAAAALQSILCFAGVALVFSFPPPERKMILLLLVPLGRSMAIAFVNATLIATASPQATLKLCRFLLWIPTIVMALLSLYGVFHWFTLSFR